MRVLSVATAILILAVGLLPANADGVFLVKRDIKLDPRSHARDIYEPAQKALIIYSGGVEHLILQVSYKGDASEFAWLVPTPSKPQVSKVDSPVFHSLHRATAPRVRYWFDADQKLGRLFLGGKLGAAEMSTPGRLDVDVLEKKQVGVYDIAVLRAGNAEDLLQWLRTNSYQITRKLSPVLRDYVERGWVFTAMRVNTGYRKRVSERLREGVLQSLKFTFRSARPVYPLRASSLNKGETDILLYVIAEHRVDEPLLDTVCSFDYYRYPVLFEVDAAPMPDRTWSSVRLTKLTAKLAPDEMTRDLVLKRASTDDTLLVADVSPPFLENLGASSLLFLDRSLTYPESVIALGLAGLVALSPFGRKRWRVWIAAGIVLVIAGIIADYGTLIDDLATYLRYNGGYAPAGVTSLALIGILAVGIAASAARHRRSAR